MSETIRVNFGRPISLIPLPDTVLLPHETMSLDIREPRNVQLVRDCLDREGQFAVATSNRRSRDAPGRDRMRDAVCVAQVIRHEELGAHRIHVWIHGVCRATISESIPADASCAYPTAHLLPAEPADGPPPSMPNVRVRLRELLERPQMHRLTGHARLLEWLDNDEIPTRALLELVSLATITETERKYRLLAEGDPFRRADIVASELNHVFDLLVAADTQAYRRWPKGMSWN